MRNIHIKNICPSLHSCFRHLDAYANFFFFIGVKIGDIAHCRKDIEPRVNINIGNYYRGIPCISKQRVLSRAVVWKNDNPKILRSNFQILDIDAKHLEFSFLQVSAPHRDAHLLVGFTRKLANLPVNLIQGELVDAAGLP